MQALLKQIKKELLSASTPEGRSAALKFVPGAEKVYGVRIPVLNELSRKYKTDGFDLITALWNSGAFEEKMLAAKLLRTVCKTDPQKALKLVEKFSTGISNWAVCDTLGMQSLKPVASKIQKEIFKLSDRLISSKNLWQRRLSLVLIEVYTKDKTLHAAIQKRVKMLEDDEEYYVKKAAEWINRNIVNEHINLRFKK